MPPPETFERNQWVVVWAKIGVTAYGQPRVTTPIEIKGRWENRRVQQLSSGQDVLLYDAVLVVDRDVPDGSLVWQGRLSDLAGTGSLSLDLLEVKQVEVLPDLKGRYQRRTLLLSRYRGRLPL